MQRVLQGRRIVIKLWMNLALCAALMSCAREDRSARTPDPSLVASGGSTASATTSASSFASPRDVRPSKALAQATPTPAGSDPSVAFSPPATLKFPSTMKQEERVPLLVILHGYGVPSALLIAKARLQTLADEKRFSYLVPDGNRDSANRPFWNVGPSCCSIDGASIDDVGRLSALIQWAARNPRVDPTRVFLIGYSNGGFMAHRLACAVGDDLAAVISISGAGPAADQNCEVKTPLAVVEIHGEVDPIVRYGGGRVFDRADFAEHPSALSSMQSWAKRLACSGKPRRSESRDLEPNLKGAETEVLGFDGCRGTVELWTVRGAAHYIALEPPGFEAMWSFLQAHPKQVP